MIAQLCQHHRMDLNSEKDAKVQFGQLEIHRKITALTQDGVRLIMIKKIGTSIAVIGKMANVPTVGV